MPQSILIVDDDKDLRALLDLILTKAEYITFQVEDAPQAIEFMRMNLPDLFIIDVMMPGMSGFELVRHLRSDPATAATPIILLSALSDQNSKDEGRASGADLYLSKPVNSKSLIPHIHNLLEQTRTG